jgi:DNA-binding beta-propeller fold protein YncE
MEWLSYTLLVIDASTHALLLVDGQQGEILTEMIYPREFTPTELVITADLAKAYLPAVDKNGNGALFVANLPSRSLYKLPLSIPHPAQFALHPDGSQAYLTTPEGALYVLDTAAMTLTPWGSPENALCVGLVVDTDYLYSVWELAENGTVAIFQLPDGNLSHEFTVPGIPTNITLTADKRIIVPFTSTASSGEGIAVFDCNKKDDNSACAVIPFPCGIQNSPYTAYPSHVALAPDNHTAYVVNEESASITVIDIDSSAITGHIPIGRSISCLHILPGGQFGIASSHMFADLSLIDLINQRALSFTDTKRELLGYIAIIPLE